MPRVVTTMQMSEEEALHRLRQMREALDLGEGLKELLSELARFEQKYGMSTLEFYARFQAGQIGDAQEFILWASLYENYVHLTQNYLKAEKMAA